MTDNQKLTINPVIMKEYEHHLNKMQLGKSKDFIKAIWNGFADYTKISLEYRWNRQHYFNAVHDTYRALCGYPASACKTLDEFFCPKLIAALKSYFGREETDRIRSECTMAMEFPYSHSFYRPSYRSQRAGDYADVFFMAMVNAIDFACYGLTAEQSLTTRDALLSGLDNRIALALRCGDKKIFALIEEAILGDNSEVWMNNLIISAIVKSGDGRALELLGKLLLAAKGQEGLRQAILETCDSGTISSHIYFIRLILENGLCRFSSVVRAFDTWSGLGFGDQKQKTAEKCMALADRYLSEEAAIPVGLDSNDTTEIYLALWALCCRDLHSATNSARQLLRSHEKYKRLVGWYFITHTNSSSYRHSVAAAHLDVRDPEELAWVCANLHQNGDTCHGGYRWDKDKEKSVINKKYFDEIYPVDKAGRNILFDQAADILEFIGRKNTKFEGSVFAWCSMELRADTPSGILISLAAYDRDPDLIRRVAVFLPLMNSDLRLAFYSLILNPEIPEQRTMLLEGLMDKSQTVRERVVARLYYYPMGEVDVTSLSATLTTQNADLRKGIITLFQQQEESLIRPVIDDLLGAQNKNQLIAGVELLDVFIKKNPALQNEYQENIVKLASSENLPQDISILLHRITSGEHTSKETVRGYGLYHPSADVFNPHICMNMRPPVPVIDDNRLKALIVPAEEDIFALYDRIAAVFYQYRDYEYEAENYNGTREIVLLDSNPQRIIPLAGYGSLQNGLVNKITDYPLAEQWLAAAGDYAADKPRLAAVLSLWRGSCKKNKVFTTWFKNLFEGYPITMDESGLAKKLENRMKAKGRYNINKINRILQAILNTGESELFDFTFSVYVNLIRKVPDDRLGNECEEDDSNYLKGNPYHTPCENGYVMSADYIQYWQYMAYQNIRNDAQFTAYFNEMWAAYIITGQREFYGIHIKDIFRAYSLGLISDDAVYLYFTDGPDAAEHMRSITGPYNGGRELLEKYPAAKPILAAAIDRIVTIEENRGELPTALTKTAAQINRFDGGARHFVSLLSALGNTGFHRGYTYYYVNRGDLTKKECLSQLLRCCQPAKDDTPEVLKDALKKAKITEKRIIQAAVYAPQWAGLLEQAMGITGLKCGVWFFHAHVNENFSAEKETETAIFSAISPQQFKDGTFDKDWFFEAYQALGEKRFNELYKNAKYITDSNSAHRRSQLYADAVLERLAKDETKAEIISKRNQEKLRAFALIPLDQNKENDALERYEFIMDFMKESRQFGSLRQASERKACAIALDNLAITTGYNDTDRMTWALEGAKIQLLRPLMEPHIISGTEIWLHIAGDGTPELNIRKNGKPLKTLPKELAKDETVLRIKEAVKQLRDQKRRARQSFESAMISRSEFEKNEITGLLNHPVLCGMVSTLVFVAGSNLGFPALNEGNLVLINTDGNKQHITDDMPLLIAHPYDLSYHKCWSEYQKALYQNHMVQPFKQIFREYYPITLEERDAVNISRRYAGHQVQPKKTAALLKTRGWTVDYEEGLQRVWHRENLIVRMYALADWFSPADIEAPTLETIQFFKRGQFDLVPFADVPPVIFSETMRDIDLAVSVAHVGGVDPETSHSTMEMRIALARELLTMLAVRNVTFQTAHAHILGSLGDYSVHMGSGVIHKSGTGMIAILPVHSQARGRIFLPFADDDPKTAEILSKILLLADDKKIKDPGIIEQIKR